MSRPWSPSAFYFSVFCLCWLTLLCPIAKAQRFTTTPAYLAGTGPLWVAVGDFNGDGIPDLAAVDGNQISVLLGKGKGGFGEPRNYTAGAYPDSIAAADFNRDGILDLVVANYEDGTVSVLLGKGDGTFGAAASYPAGTNPSYLVVGDFNGDGNPDVVVVNATPVYHQMETISVLLGKGDGTLQAPKSTAVDYYLAYMAVADFNKDGKQDLVISAANYNDVPEMDILLGNGDGTFTELYPIGGAFGALVTPGGIVVADFNGDGNPDFAVVAPRGVGVFLGNGSGGFSGPQFFPADQPEGTVVAGDFNGDGKTDLVVANQSSNDVSVLLGNGDGTFQAPVNYCSGAPNNYVVAADLNGDGKLDVAVSTVYALTTIFGNGDGTLQAQINYGTNVSSLALVGDLNGDGIPDVLAGSSDGRESFLGNGDGTFTAFQQIGTGGAENVLGDFNNDGKLDLAMEFPYGGAEVQVLFGTGNGGFWGEGPAQQIPYSGNMVAADFNRDGNLDLAIAGFANQGGEVVVLLGNGDGSFQKPATYNADEGPWGITAADLNGDGIPDLAVANSYSNDVSILIGKGDGTFYPSMNYPAGAGPYALAVGDFNGDGKLDLIVANNGAPGLTVLLGNGDGTFRQGSSFGDAYGCYDVAVADFDGDGKLDIAAYCDFQNAYGNAATYRGKGDGTFHKPEILNISTFPPPGSPLPTISVSDLNRDGAPDLIVAGTNFTALLNKGGTHVLLRSSPNPSHQGEMVTFKAHVKPSVKPDPEPTGTVTFRDGSKKLAKVALVNGLAEFQTDKLTVGTHEITAAYSGDRNFNPNQSPVLTQTVKP